MAIVRTPATATGRYTGPGLYEVTDGTRVYLDPIPEEMAEYHGDMLIWSDTAENRANLSRNWLGRRDVIEPAIVRKIEETGQ